MITEQTHFKTDLKTLIMIIAAIAIAVWTYSEINNRLTKLETSEQLMKQDLLEASKQLPIDQEQFMLLEHISLQVEKLTTRVDDMMHNKVNITRLQKDVEKILVDVEKLKDGQRGLLNGGRNHK